MSFFEKLKKGMGVEQAETDAETEIETEKKEAEEEISREPAEEKEQEIKEEKKKTKKKEIQVKEKEAPQKETSEKIPAATKKEKVAWSALSKDGEGQLAVDVYQNEDFLVIQSAIAGVKPESLDIVIEGDMVSIKGLREKPEETGERNYFYQECFWGPFSRQIILSVEVDSSRTDAILKDGILTIKVPKIERERKRKITVKG
jgi:HSP20 family molecular chaperone IbpA